MELTNDQNKALEAMQNWYNLKTNDKLDLFFLLYGAAGTGKTTVMKYFINKIGTNNIAISAPTHKAKKIIQSITGFHGETIQKLLGLRPNVALDKFDINNPQFDPIGEESIGSYKIIIIDESSMLNKDAYNLIIDRASFHGIKILFLGDMYQIPPVNEKMSEVYIKTKHIFALTQIVRQGDVNPNSALLRLARKDIENNTNTLLDKLLIKGTNLIEDQGYHIVNNVDFGKELLTKLFSSEYEYNKDYIKYLAWTNNSVEKWCIALRKQIFGEAAKEPLLVGESLTGYNTVTTRSAIIIENSEDYTITNIKATTTDKGIKGYEVKLKLDIGTTREVFIVHPEQFEEYILMFDTLLHQAQKYKGKNWGTFYTFKDSHLMIRNIYKEDCKKLYLKAHYKTNLIDKKDLYYSYGCTVHKSQGSTYTNTAINVKDICSNPDEEERRKLLYVAFSRCTNENIILLK
jgi:hypothetical protein